MLPVRFYQLINHITRLCASVLPKIVTGTIQPPFTYLPLLGAGVGSGSDPLYSSSLTAVRRLFLPSPAPVVSLPPCRLSVFAAKAAFLAGAFSSLLPLAGVLAAVGEQTNTYLVIITIKYHVVYSIAEPAPFFTGSGSRYFPLWAPASDPAPLHK